ncbi:MAG: LamG-like jellyroll fold domain-containing protein [Myxococcales bacterium]|nr:LamG domain-containing protein [Myxococcota bacterium]MDW8283008.1 LamG-like jellyroll fold domain-containing protein [Myxococcales bacterium]
MRISVFALAILLAVAACGQGPLDPVGAQTVVEPVGWGAGKGEGQWSYRPLGAHRASDMTVEVVVRIEEAAAHGHPVHQIDRFVDYTNNEDLGGYEAGVSLRWGQEGQYRFMLSAFWGEVLLWSSRAGVLAVRPAPIEVGREHRVRASAEGPRLRLWLDDTLIIDAWDEGLSVGGAALGRKDGRSWFGPATLVLGPQSVPLVLAQTPHQPSLSLRIWKGLPWGFDGDEPLFALGLPPDLAQVSAARYGATAFDLKLRPHHAPQLFLPLFLQNFGSEPFVLGRLAGLRVTAEGERLGLVLELLPEEEGGGLRGRTALTVDYDAQTGSYRYEVRAELVVPEGKPLRTSHPINLTNPGFYNVVPSASPQGRTWPVTLTHAVYQHESGALYRLPLNHAGHYPGYGSGPWFASRAGYIRPDGGFYAYVGDPTSNPVFEILEPAARREFDSGPCGVGYDIHLRWVPGGMPGGVLAPGTYSVRWRLRSASGPEAQEWLARSSLATPRDLDATWLLYTGGVGHVERFDRVVLQASPFAEYPWGPGALQDKTVGRTDRTSLRLDGPRFGESAAGSGRFMEPIEPGVEYEVSAWVRTEHVQGEGPGIVFGGRAYYPGLRGTVPWRRIGFVVRPREPLDVVPFALHNSGSGRVWFDDFLIRPLPPGVPPSPGVERIERSLRDAALAPRHDVLLLWTADSDAGDPARTVLDLSGHGHHATLEGAEWTSDGGGRVLRFSGHGSHVLMRGHPGAGFPEPASLSLWLRPGIQPEEWAVVASGAMRDQYDLWRLLLVRASGSSFWLVVHVQNTQLMSARPVVAAGRWHHLLVSHDGTHLRGYLDGQLVIEGAAPTPWLGRGEQAYFRLGGGIIEGELHSPYVGLVGPVRVFPAALGAPEAAAQYAAGLY